LGSTESDKVLIERCRKGDSTAFEMLVLKYQQNIFHLIYHLTNSGEHVEDLAQDVFLKAFKAIKGFRGDSCFYTWLYRIAVNTALSFRRSAAVQMSRTSVSLDENVRHEDSDSKRDIPNGRYEASATLHEKELKERISQAIAALEPELRAPVVLRDIEELSYEEIAEILEVPRGTVKSRLHRGRLVLREKLQSFF